jgi:elongator complex protein 1
MTMIFLQEYLPILNKYKAMPEDYMKYSIDKHLKRWETALTHIAR